MNETFLPPSPNWYLSNVLVCSKRGTVAWGARNCIVIARQKEDNNSLEYSVISDVYKEKITALAFSPICEANGEELLICCGDNDEIKIWNIDTMSLFALFAFGDGKPVVGVDWSIKNDNLACAINSEGSLMICEIRYQSNMIISLGRLTATCLACCPHNDNIVAIGLKNGLVYIINIQKKLIKYKLRGHDVEVVSLSWCPSEMNVLNENNKRDLLLASGAKDKSIFIWKAGGDGRYETILTLPNQPISTDTSTFHLHKNKLNIANGAWTVVQWIEPQVLLTSSIWGELLVWNLSTKGKPACQLLHTHHNRGLFCIAAIAKSETTEPDNWRTDSEFTVWTLAQDRWILCCHREKDGSITVKHKIPTQNGYIYCIAACPFDTSHIALGVGDMMLRLWNLSEPHKTIFDVTMLWQKIKGKLRTISWHPEYENLLAFGTGEGRVGVFDTNVFNKPPILYRQYYRRTIYKLEWGPMPNHDSHFLFSCAEGELVAYDPAIPHELPHSILKKNCMEFSWKPDYSCLAVALENGSIVLYNRDFKKCGNTIHIFNKTINCLVWHPESTVRDVSLSSLRNCLAVASDSSSIVIFDISDLINNLSKDAEEAITEMCEMSENVNINQQPNARKIATLNGHSEKVVCLAWSPHFSGYLVSGSYDNTAQVWNVEKQELIATFTGHKGPVLCCMWSPLKSHLIITGSSDFIVRIWDCNSSSQSPKKPSDMEDCRKKKSKHNSRKIQTEKADKSEAQNNTSIINHSINKTAISATEKHSNIVPVKDISKKKTGKKISSIIHGKVNAVINSIEHDIMKKQGQNKSQSPDQQEENYDIAKSLFSEKEDFEAIFANEKAAYATENKHDTVTQLDIWSDNLKKNIETAAKEKRLNDFLVSLAPHVSVKMWKEMCEAYANQLLLEGNIEKAVSYLLMIYKIYKAIDIFVNAKMYKDAYVLARYRLDADDPALKDILRSWAEYATQTGRLEQATHCYMQLEDFEKAAKILGRRKDAHCLYLASQLAFISEDKEFGIFLMKEAIVRAVVELNYVKARSIINNNPQMQYLEVYVHTYEELVDTYKKDIEHDPIQMWMTENSDSGVLQILDKKYDTTHYYALRDHASNVTLENEIMMRCYVNCQIAMAVTCDSKEMQLKHITTALNTAFQYELINVNNENGFFTHILTKLDTKKPMDEKSIYAKSSLPISKSIRAYLCTGLLDWLLNNLDRLPIEEEIKFTNLIIDLLNDTLHRETMEYWFWTTEINKLENRLISLTDEVINQDDESKGLVEKINKLKLNKKNFTEERICVPNPIAIYCKTNELVNILRDDANKCRFQEIITDLWNEDLQNT